MIQISKVLSAAVVILGLKINPAQGQEASTFCRRWDHQSVVLDNKLYLFGGRKLYLEHIQDPDDEAYNGGAGVPSNDFMVLDLSKPWQLEKDKVLTNPPKWEPINAPWIEGQSSPPGIAGGGLFTYKDKGESGILLYDGKYYPLKTESENPKDRKSQCVSFSAERNEWKLEDAWSNPQTDGVESTVVSRFSRGTAVDVPDQNLGFYVGGARIWEWEKDYDWYYPDGVQLAQVDFDGTGIVRKMKPMLNNTKSIAPSAVWVPIGEKGSLIVVGGTKEEDDDRLSASDSPNAQYERPTVTKMRPFDKTLIYEIAKGEWYEQETMGVPLPWPRQNACLVHRSFHEPNGNITHQLFLYGGGTGSSFGLGDPMDDEDIFGDLYVLSMPGFRWLQFTSIPHAPNARTRQTCHVVNERHLFVVGGGRNDSLKTDPGLKSSCVWDDLSVLDMTKMEWLLEYTPNKDPYEVNPTIRRDSLYNGAPRTEPEAGWSPGVQEWFQSQYPKNDTKEKGDENENKNNKGDNKLALIVGVVVGCFVAILLGLLARCYWLRRRKVVTPDDANATDLGIGTKGQPDMENSFTPVEMSTDSEVCQSDHSFGWTGSHGYTPVPILVDENGPYTFNTAGGQVYASELDGNPIMSSSLFAAELDTNSAASGSQDKRGTPHRHSSFAVRNSMALSSATETTGFMESSSAPISPYLPSESSSPVGLVAGEPHHIRWRMTEEDSNRISRDVEELLRIGSTSATSENDEK